MNPVRRFSAIALLLVAQHCFAGTTEFCLDGEFNLGYRLQHHRIADGWVPTTWCVITEDDSNRTLFSMTGKSNPDMDGDWSVAYEPPDTVRIVNRESPPDIEFQGTDNLDEALSVRRMDPRRLYEEHRQGPISDIRLGISDGRVRMVLVDAILPIHGKRHITWSWNWENPDQPRLIVSTEKDSKMLFRGSGNWRDISETEAKAIWAITPGVKKVVVPGDRWPARVNMQLISLTDNVYLVRGVRTGFQHLVVDTEDGLIVADAPASWLEFHQIPPRRFLPELSTYGISENLIEFLGAEFPLRPIHAVALTHFHDDHSGGAPAFAEVGATVYATPSTAEFLNKEFPRRYLPRKEVPKADFDVHAVSNVVTLGAEGNRVKIVSMGDNPHVFEMLGVWAVDRNYFFVSDIHVPRNEANEPAAARAETECWFADWVVHNLPPEVRVANSHSPIVTPVARLAKYLESDVCGGE